MWGVLLIKPDSICFSLARNHFFYYILGFGLCVWNLHLSVGFSVIKKCTNIYVSLINLLYICSCRHCNMLKPQAMLVKTPNCRCLVFCIHGDFSGPHVRPVCQGTAWRFCQNRIRPSGEGVDRWAREMRRQRPLEPARSFLFHDLFLCILSGSEFSPYCFVGTLIVLLWNEP